MGENDQREPEDRAETEGLGTHWEGIPEGTSGSAAPGTEAAGDGGTDDDADPGS